MFPVDSSVSHIVFSLITLTFLEIVLSVDNLVFISVFSQRLPIEDRAKARQWGLGFALITRLMLLASALWLTELNKPVLTVLTHAYSLRDLFLMAGGLFLLYKSTAEIHAEVEEPNADIPVKTRYIGLKQVVAQIAVIDIIFSFDSIFTAIGITREFVIMAVAISIAICVMIFASGWLSRFIHDHPTVRILALSFLLLIGVMLIADGFHLEVPKSYIYFAITFSMFVEFLNSVASKRRKRST